MVTDRELSTSLTSADSLRWRIPSLTTVGTKFRMMPNFFHWMPTAPSPDDTGMGNSPPARNLASCPDIATSVGSASVLDSPFDSSRLRIALNGRLGSPEKNREKDAPWAGVGISGLSPPVPGIARNCPGTLDD